MDKHQNKDEKLPELNQYTKQQLIQIIINLNKKIEEQNQLLRQNQNCLQINIKLSRHHKNGQQNQARQIQTLRSIQELLQQQQHFTNQANNQSNQNNQNPQQQQLNSIITTISQSLNQSQNLFEAFYIFGIKENINTIVELYQFNNYESKEVLKSELLIDLIGLKDGKECQILYNDEDAKKLLFDEGQQLNNQQFYSTILQNNLLQNSKMNQNIIDQFNCEQNLFVFCFDVIDFYSFFDVNEKLYRYKYTKTYCFITYLPLHNIFQQLLLYIHNEIKQLRQLKFQQDTINKPENKIILHNSANSIQYCSDLLNKILKQIKPIQENSNCIKIQFENQTIQYIIPKKKSQDDNRAILANISRQIFTGETIQIIFACLLLEYKIIIIHEKLSILTALIQFLSLISYPISWQSIIMPIISNKLKNKILNLNCPMIVGITSTKGNKNKEVITINEILQQCPKTLIFIGGQILINEQKTIPPLQLDEKILLNFQKEQSPIEEISYQFKQKEQQLSTQILDTFKYFIKNQIIGLISNLDNSLIYKKQLKTIELMQLIKQSQNNIININDELLNQIIQTNYFKNYAYNEYGLYIN